MIARFLWEVFNAVVFISAIGFIYIALKG